MGGNDETDDNPMNKQKYIINQQSSITVLAARKGARTPKLKSLLLRDFFFLPNLTDFPSNKMMTNTGSLLLGPSLERCYLTLTWTFICGLRVSGMLIVYRSRPVSPRVSAFSPGRYSRGITPIPTKLLR